MFSLALDPTRTWYLGLHPSVRLELNDTLTCLNLEDPKDLNKMNSGSSIFMGRFTDGGVQKVTITPIKARDTSSTSKKPN